MSAGVEAMSSEALARRIAAVALDKKARDLVVLDMRDVVSYTDFLVIATGNTERQTKAIQEGIHQELKHPGGGPEAGAGPRRGSRGGALDPDGLPRRGGARVHARRA